MSGGLPLWPCLRHRLLLGATALAFGWLVAAGAEAQVLAQQTPEAAKEQEKAAEEQIEQQATAAEAAERADERAALVDVSFQDVLRSPDDPEVNLAYARRLVSEGRLNLAATSLERILLINPELDQVRLFYAVVLFRLDHLDEAEAEFRLLQDRGRLVERQLAEVERFLAMIAQRRAPFKQTATVSAGLHYDHNRNAFPEGGNFLVLGVPFVTGGDRNDDIGRLFIATYGVDYDTGGQRWQQAFGDMSFVFDEQIEEDGLDLWAVIFDGGMLYRAPFADIIPGVRMSYVTLDRERYLRSVAGKIEVRRELIERKLDAFARVTTGYETFDDTDRLPFASEQDGPFTEIRWGGGWTITPKIRLTLQQRFKDKDASPEFEAFQSFLTEAALTFALERGMFAVFDGFIDKEWYDAPDPFISARKRKDTNWSIGLTYGIPLGTIDDLMPFGEADGPQSSGFWRSIVLSMSANYFRSTSNVPNFTYNNFRFQALFTKRWRF